MRRALGVALAALQGALGYNNGYARAPPLGWQTWCAVGPCGTDHCFDQQIRETAKALVDNGMKDLGYEWVVLDDCWHPSRDSHTGELVPYPNFFPNGMVPVIDYVHSLGLKFGLYTSIGTKTCHGGWSPGSYGHIEQDANTFASWGVDYVKVDWCGSEDKASGHKELSAAMNKTGRPMVLELCRGAYQQEDKWGYAPGIAQVWRASGDHHDNFNSVLSEVAAVKGRSSWSGPYGWAYLDMMMTGGQGCQSQYNDSTKEWDWTRKEHCPGQTDNEYRTEASLYMIVASPIMVGTDIRNMTAIMRELLLNPEALAVNQDWQSPPGDETVACKGANNSVWVRKLSNGNFAAVVPNLGSEAANVTLCLDAVGWVHGGANVRDIWARKDLGTVTAEFTASLQPHDSAFVILSPAK